MICVLQFDAASVRVLERLLGEGRLEALAGLAARGKRYELETPAVDFAAGAFHTLYSGVPIGDHGLFYPFQFVAEEQRVRYATAFPAPDAIWERLARRGMRSLVLDPYESRPPRLDSGDLACGVGFRDRVVLPRWASSGRVAAVARRGPQATEIFGRPRAAELVRLREKLVEAPMRTARAAVELLGANRYEMAWITLPASHLAGHQFWDLSQLADGPGAGARAVLERALDDVYESVDRAIATVLEALDPADDVIVTSAVGMDVNTSRADLLPQMLGRILSEGSSRADEEAGAIWRLRAGVPARLRRAVASSLPDRVALELTSRLELRGIDWAETTAFAHPADNQGYIRLNLRGRERLGIVELAEAQELRAAIASGLATFRDPDGAPAVASVERVPPLYPGAKSDLLPDLAVRWSERPATELGYVESDRFGRISRQGAGSGRSGNHTAGDAWAIVAPGASRHADRPETPRLEDVAATVSAVTGGGTDGLAGQSLLD